MRTVPTSQPLTLKTERSTKQGRSDWPPCGDHCIAAPSAPAIDVKVPHSCATSGTGSAGVPNARAVTRTVAIVRLATEADRNGMVPPRNTAAAAALLRGHVRRLDDGVE